MIPQRLPNRRLAEIFEVACHDLRYAPTIGRLHDGRVAEVFIENIRLGSQSDSYARDSAIATSLALQYGCPLEVLQRALLRDAQGRASTPLGVALDLIAAEGAR